MPGAVFPEDIEHDARRRWFCEECDAEDEGQDAIATAAVHVEETHHPVVFVSESHKRMVWREKNGISLD